MKAKIFLGLCVAALLAVCTGCVALAVGAGAGVGTYAYISGELSSNEAVTLDKAYKATQRALKDDMHYAVTEDQKDAASARLTARGAGDKKIAVKLERESDTVTKVKIRVGTFGDESLSRQILEKIKKRL